MKTTYKIISIIYILSGLQIAQGATTSTQLPIKTEVRIPTCQLEFDDSMDFSAVKVDDIIAARAASKETAINLRCDSHVDNVQLKFVPGSSKISSDKKVMHSGTTGLGYTLQWSRAGVGFSDILFNTQYSWSNSDSYEKELNGKLMLKPVTFPGETLTKEGKVISIINIEVTYG
ncbi:hypothetical protein [Providencia rustigianii]|uniref:Fimbrial-type adhesion domain-containing protein n=1 Tax=Providencia rustigianii DSM 4541 TaxID=500637 RepID=D1P768_9GAMM|nr:hypothetical protein [Providencia rustigianii]EFB70915.1 putative protein FanG [Providencia rustigianii DSM 4541]SUC25514.1 Uncharacterised protein [Providencia rustigianii]